MKIFFALMLIASVASVFYELDDGLYVMAHNHYRQRHDLLLGTYLPSNLQQPEHMSTSLGLTQKELAQSDKYIADGYEQSVKDGYRLGDGYSRLSLQCLGVSLLLFVSSLLGLRTVGKRDTRINQPVPLASSGQPST